MKHMLNVCMPIVACALVQFICRVSEPYVDPLYYENQE